MSLTWLAVVALLVAVATAQPVGEQLIFAPAQFDNATQWGIGVAATPTHSAGFIVGFNYTDGRAFAQYYEQNATQAWVERMRSCTATS